MRQLKRMAVVSLAFGVFLLAGSDVLFAQRDFSKVEIKATHVAGNVHMLTGAGGNIGVSNGKDGVLIVDDQFAPLANQILAALREIGSMRLRFILNTHWHGDHTGGNVALAHRAPIVAHANVRRRLETGMDLPGRKTPPAPEAALPILTFDQSMSIYFNGEEIRVIHFPESHTDGDSVIFFTESNVVHMGDNLFSGMFPFVDLDSGGDVEGLARSVGKILAMLPEDVKIIPGHGPLSTKEDLKTFHEMLLECLDLVRGKMKAGKTVIQIQDEGVPERWKDWAWGFVSTDRWLETVHRSLSK
jgi:glyoxylase-like metal-dependent hydrolase (beta-lactamase superfamily II)